MHFVLPFALSMIFTVGCMYLLTSTSACNKVFGFLRSFKKWN